MDEKEGSHARRSPHGAAEAKAEEMVRAACSWSIAGVVGVDDRAQETGEGSRLLLQFLLLLPRPLVCLRWGGLRESRLCIRTHVQ